MTYRELEKAVIKAQKGDDTSFAKLYNHFSDSIFYLALRIVKNEEDANDIVQETFVKLYKSLHSITNPITITKFINKIAYNTSLNYLRDGNKEVLLHDADLNENIPEVEEDFIPEEYMKQKETRDAVIKVLDELSESQRSVIVFFYFQNLSISEIAEIMNISQQAVKNRLLRARNNMKEKLLMERLGGVLIAVTSVTVLSQILSLDAKASGFDKVKVAVWEKTGAGIGFSPRKTAKLSKIIRAPGVSELPLPRERGATFGAGTGAKKALMGVLVATAVGTGIWVTTREVQTSPQTQIQATFSQGNLKPLRYSKNTVITAEMISQDAEIVMPDHFVFQRLDAENVDIKMAGEYGVYLYYENTITEELVILPIIIIIIE